jgi:predicted DNA-binding transcriptional regulator YafY
LKRCPQSDARWPQFRVWQIEVWLETTLEEAQRHIPLSMGHFAEANQGVLIRCEVDDLPWMARLLAGLGMPFVIHHPPELRTVLRHYALKMMSYAERDEPEGLGRLVP